MSKSIKMIGRKYGSLTVLEAASIYISPGGTCKDRKWLCKCDCGKDAVVRGSFLRNGHTKSCGKCKAPTIVGEKEHYRCICADGNSFIFDAEDMSVATAHNWAVWEDGYVRCGKMRFHREILGLRNSKKAVVDHINGDTTDNRRNNLRIVSQHRNCYNQGMHKNSNTGYKGVCFDTSRSRYMAHIHPDRKMVFLGYYSTPEAAAAAYNKAAITYYGENARLNIIGMPFSTISAKEVLAQ